MAFGFDMHWLALALGAAVTDAEAASSASLLFLVLPLFASSAFVPTDTMPGWLQAIADNSPYTAVIDTIRGLTGGGPVASNLGPAALWTLGFLVLAVPLATTLYRRATT